MTRNTIFWVDLRVIDDKKYHLLSRLNVEYLSYYISDTQNLGMRIAENEPAVLCFHFDIPNSPGLTLVEKIKIAFPSIPILMVTRSHSESLVLWALRTRVWDIFIEPVEEADFLDVLSTLYGFRIHSGDRERKSVSRLRGYSTDTRNSSVEKAITKGKKYIREHYAKELRLSDVAKHVGLSASHFSRLFKQQTQSNFIDFLWSIRIDVAKTMLLNPDAAISNVALEIGCTDLSYFSSKFRKLTTMTPSDFQQIAAHSAESFDTNIFSHLP